MASIFALTQRGVLPLHELESFVADRALPCRVMLDRNACNCLPQMLPHLSFAPLSISPGISAIEGPAQAVSLQGYEQEFHKLSAKLQKAGYPLSALTACHPITKKAVIDSFELVTQDIQNLIEPISDIYSFGRGPNGKAEKIKLLDAKRQKSAWRQTLRELKSDLPPHFLMFCLEKYFFEKVTSAIPISCFAKVFKTNVWNSAPNPPDEQTAREYAYNALSDLLYPYMWLQSSRPWISTDVFLTEDKALIECWKQFTASGLMRPPRVYATLNYTLSPGDKRPGIFGQPAQFNQYPLAQAAIQPPESPPLFFNHAIYDWAISFGTMTLPLRLDKSTIVPDEGSAETRPSKFFMIK